MDTVDALRLFVGVVDSGGFAAAGRNAGLSRSVVNRAVIQLEERLGVQLLRRSTRRVSVTDAGIVLYQQAQGIIGDLDALLAAVADRAERPHGDLRINAPMSFGTLHLATLVARYMSAHPAVRVELVLSDRRVDPIEEGFDLTFRIGEPQFPTSLVEQDLAPIRRVVCAAPAYLDAHGVPASPRELRDHRCLQYGYHASGNAWQLGGASRAVVAELGCVMWSNNGEALRDAAVAGQGVALLPTFIVGDALRDGRLRRILEDHPLPDLRLVALYPRHRHLSPKVRELVRLVEAGVGEPPYWDLP